MRTLAVLSGLVALCCFGCCLVAPAFGQDQGITDEQKAKLRQYKESCVADTGVDQALIERVKKGEEVQPDEKLNCFSACMLKKVAIMKPDGTIDEEVARAKMPAGLTKEKIDEVINTCKTQVGQSACETGGKVMSCMLKTQALSILV